MTVWGRKAEIASEYLTKGSPVLIEGRLKLDTWEKDGQKHSKLKVVCEQCDCSAVAAARVVPAASGRKARRGRPSAAAAVLHNNTISPVRRTTSMTCLPRKCPVAVTAVAAVTTFPSNSK